MKRITALMLTLLLSSVFIVTESSRACTNFLITKGASKDGSTMITYSADSHVLYGELYYWPAMKYKRRYHG
ncbi:MAG: C69 family dipeptidase [Marinilabiliales bacterium]|nr:C69 family dipeptidase [Marinilabiliales bacterium]